MHRLIATLVALFLAACGTPHWGYEGEHGPAHWGDLNADWSVAKNGQRQSPIDLSEVPASDLPDLRFAYAPAPLVIVNNGHTVQVSTRAGSTLRVGDASYELLQFHFHAPSEHTLQGQHLPLELHLVHKDSQGNLCVVGVLFREGAANGALAPIWDHLPRHAGPALQIAGVEIDAAKLLPGGDTHWTYPGSLTTPPCSEGVRWIVMQETLSVSKDQLAAFRRCLHGEGNSRPTQPLHGREVMLGR